MRFRKYFVSGYRLNDEQDRYPDDEEVYKCSEVDTVYSVAKERFAELDKKYESTRHQLAIAREALDTIDKAALSNAWKKKIAREALDAIKQAGEEK